MKKRPTKEIKISEMKYPNLSIGYDENGRRVEFKGGILGQTINVKTGKKNKERIRAKYINLIEESKLENAREYCPHAGVCGGCAYQKIPYETELMLKHDMIKTLFKDSGITYNGNIKINRSAVTKGYRNKMEYTFGDAVKGGPLILGLHRQRRFYEIVDCYDCNIVDDDFNKIRDGVQKYFREKNTDFYHKTTKEGLLRHLVVRKAHHTGQIMVILVTSSDESFDDIRLRLFMHMLLDLDLDGRIFSIYHVLNDSLADAVIPEKIKLIYGKEYITEEMLGLSFKISPFSFFQPNVFTAEKLYQKAFDLAEIDSSMNVLDLYSGTGTITQLMATVANTATGIEIVEEAVEKARENAKLNELNNVNFLCGDVLEEIEKVGDKYDVVILDPPRAGISPASLDKILNIDCKKFVYISCNPKSQMDNLKVFLEKGYEIKDYEIFDQFPNSRHLEAIALLERS
ncbi:23S rRNA (uracil(1939)-C(5))-methyltransferase RlmD [Anaerococcus sp. NML200537]|uniref:23S rRNA (uracil(1939)-C(5))-methyltransferase RlmD n=1 Tax=Anaerococcus sp. NML200537 TaxID=2954485 RepID=UPI0022376535|nr:23S rRNA (uracil(1939)-C(5))-methyltransferase RlmD [Anaerococcus sp. NML200537]MCW6700671.1 23S rRNA (uracil(1939)-C(5))-methyltransferase RlmD [Anaerococcus sp. NML200537]